jgi:hypothetical protein
VPRERRSRGPAIKTHQCGLLWVPGPFGVLRVVWPSERCGRLGGSTYDGKEVQHDLQIADKPRAGNVRSFVYEGSVKVDIAFLGQLAPRCPAGGALQIIAPRRHPTTAVAIADKVGLKPARQAVGKSGTLPCSIVAVGETCLDGGGGRRERGSSLRLMVLKPGVGRCPLQASSRDDP